MQLDLDLATDEVAIQDAVQRFCDYSLGRAANERAAVGFSRPLWTAFAQLGVIEACHPDYPGGMLQACVGLEVLGHAGFPGPAPHVVAAAGVLDAATWEQVSAGTTLVTFGIGPVIPWANEADLVLAVAGERLRRLPGGQPLVETLGQSRSGRVEVAEGEDCGAAAPALARYDAAVAAFVQGAGRAVMEAAADHARTRRQFGKSIGEFQAVAFPLAEALMGLNAARTIARFAAMAIDSGRADAGALAAAARISACRAALKASFSAHQVFGASGQLVDGPVAWLSRPVQEYATQTRGLKTLREQLPLDVVGALDLDAWAA